MNENAGLYRVITYNTHLFLGTALVSEQYEGELRLEKIASRLEQSGAECVGLCEVWADSVKERLIQRLRQAFPYSYFHKNTGVVTLGPGLLLLSKYRLTRTSFTRYKNLVGTDWFADKGILTARAIVPDQKPVTILLTHTQAGKSGAQVEARRSNLQQLQTVFREHRSIASPTCPGCKSFSAHPLALDLVLSGRAQPFRRGSTERVKPA